MRISGRITTRPGIPTSGLTVVAFDKDLRSSQELGQTQTQADGRYAIDYSREKFARAEKRAADVFIEVRPRGKGTPGQSVVHYNAPESIVIDLVLEEDFFGYSVQDGFIVPDHPEYWSIREGETPVFVRG